MRYPFPKTEAKIRDRHTVAPRPVIHSLFMYIAVLYSYSYLIQERKPILSTNLIPRTTPPSSPDSSRTPSTFPGPRALFQARV